MRKTKKCRIMNPNQTTQPAKDSQIGLQAESSISHTNQHNPVVLAATGVAPISGRSLVDTGGTAPAVDKRESVQTSEVSNPRAPDRTTSAPGSAVTPTPASQQPHLTPAVSTASGVPVPTSAPSEVPPTPVSQQARPAGATASAGGNPNPKPAPSVVTPTPVSQQPQPAAAIAPAGGNPNPAPATSAVTPTPVSQQARPAGATAPVSGNPFPAPAPSEVTPIQVSQQARPAGATALAGGNPVPVSAPKPPTASPVTQQSIPSVGSITGSGGVVIAPTTTNATHSNWTLALKAKIHAIHLPLSLALASGFRSIGVTEDVIHESGESEAQRLTDELMEGIEKYGFQRALITKVPAEKIMVQFIIIASTVKSGSSVLQSSVFKGQGGQVSSGLNTKIFDTLLETSLAVANFYVKIGIAEEVAREAAHAEAARLTAKLKVEVEKYAVFRAQNAEVSVDRILRQFAKIAGVAWEPSPKQTNTKTKGKAKGGKGEAKGKK
jgi:hypothetical protein